MIKAIKIKNKELKEKAESNVKWIDSIKYENERITDSLNEMLKEKEQLEEKIKRFNENLKKEKRQN